MIEVIILFITVSSGSDVRPLNNLTTCAVSLTYTTYIFNSIRVYLKITPNFLQTNTSNTRLRKHYKLYSTFSSNTRVLGATLASSSILDSWRQPGIHVLLVYTIKDTRLICGHKYSEYLTNLQPGCCTFLQIRFPMVKFILEWFAVEFGTLDVSETGTSFRTRL